MKSGVSKMKKDRHRLFRRWRTAVALVVAAIALSACRTDIITRIDTGGQADVAVAFGGEMAAWFRENPAEAEQIAQMVAGLGEGEVGVSDRGSEIVVSQRNVPLSKVTEHAPLTGIGGVEVDGNDTFVKFVAPQSIVDAVAAAVEQAPTRDTMYDTTFVVVEIEGDEVSVPEGAAPLWERQGRQITIYRDVSSLLAGDEIWQVTSAPTNDWGRLAIAGLGALAVTGAGVTWWRRRQQVTATHPGDPQNIV